MRRGGNLGDTYSQATLFAYSDQSPAPFTLTLSDPCGQYLLSARYALAYTHSHPLSSVTSLERST